MVSSSSQKNLNSALYNLIIKSQYQYTRKLCLEQCLQMHLIEDCGCMDHTLSLFDAQHCSSYTQSTCMNRMFQSKYLMSGFFEKNCMSLCPLECSIIEYNYRLSQNKLMSHLYADSILQNKNLTADFVTVQVDWRTATESVVALNIFYDSLAFTMSSESAKMNVVSLLAAIGGNLGLFLGVSLFSVGELVIVLLEAWFVLWERKKILNKSKENRLFICQTNF